MAIRRPNATSTAPVTASRARRILERRSRSPILATASEQQYSQPKVMVQNSSPSSTRAAKLEPNCGSRPVKNTAIFGLLRSLSRPRRKWPQLLGRSGGLLAGGGPLAWDGPIAGRGPLEGNGALAWDGPIAGRGPLEGNEALAWDGPIAGGGQFAGGGSEGLCSLACR